VSGDPPTPIRLVPLGNSGLRVSRLCAGTGTAGFAGQSRQGALPPGQLAAILLHAWQLGISFWDTSDDYGTQPEVAQALLALPPGPVVVSTKTHAATVAEAQTALECCRRELGMAVIDLLYLHEVDSPGELERRRPALEFFHQARHRGLIRAVGASTHAINSLEYMAGRQDIQVIMTNFNLAGLHMDASQHDYLAALEACHQAGQGTVVMKTLAEGLLSHRAEEALAGNLAIPFVDSVCVGFTSQEEVTEITRMAGKQGSI